MPNHAIQPNKNAWMTIFVQVLVSGMTSNQRVKQPPQVSRWVKPCAGGTGPTKSTWTWLNLASGGWNGPRGTCVDLNFGTLTRQVCASPVSNVLVKMLGQMYLEPMKR